MGHPKRLEFIKELSPKLGNPTIVLDKYNDRWETGKRALLSHKKGAKWHMIIQDDAIICKDLIKGALNAAKCAGIRPIGLYLGNPRPHPEIVGPALEEAIRKKCRWIEMQGPWWGVGIIIPVCHIEAIVKFGDKEEHPNFDRKIARFYDDLGIKCWYPVPSLVDHRPEDENPSLVRDRSGNRKARLFIGQENSAQEIVWDKTLVKAKLYTRK